MRVYLTTDVVGGVWDYTATLASGLVGAGHAVRVAVIGAPDPGRLALLPVEAEVVAADHRLEWMPGALDTVARAGEWLAADAGAWSPDIVHLNQLSYAVHDFGAPTVVAVHSDVLSWFLEVKGIDAPDEWAAYADAVRAGLRAADTVVAPSVYQSSLTLRHYGRGADRIVHNGVRASREAAGGPAVSATRPGGLPGHFPSSPDRPLVVSAGRAWDAAKGMEVLDGAAGLLGRGGLDVHVLGDTAGPYGERFVGRHVDCHGAVPREEVDRWMSRASIYVAASLYEPFGLAPLEAAFHGTALVLSDIGSFRELWDGCAAFFPRGDPAALAEVLAELAADPDRRTELATAARVRAESSFTAERFTTEYLDLYEVHQPCA